VKENHDNQSMFAVFLNVGNTTVAAGNRAERGRAALRASPWISTTASD
jgi:hypothetical protein